MDPYNILFETLSNERFYKSHLFGRESFRFDEDKRFIWSSFHQKLKPTTIVMFDCVGKDFIVKSGFEFLEGNPEKFLCISEKTLQSAIKKRDWKSLAVLLNNCGCKQYLGRQYGRAKVVFMKLFMILDTTLKTSGCTGLNANLQCLRFTVGNNYACAAFKDGELGKALVEFRILCQMEIKAQQGSESDIQKDSVSKDLSLCYAHNSTCEKLNLVVLIINYSCASLSCENYDDQIVRDLEKALEVCHHWFAKSENHAVKRLLSLTLARILAAHGKLKQAFVVYDLESIDELTILKDFDESPLAIFYVKEMCFLLAQRGERDRAKEYLEVALKSCKEIYDERHAMVLAVTTQIGQLFQPRTTKKPPSLKYSAACEVRSLGKLNEHSAAGEAGLKDLSYTSEEGNLMLLSGCDSLLLLFLNSREQFQEKMITISWCVIPHMKSLLTKSIKVETKAEDILSKVHPLLTKKAWLSRSSEDKCHIIAALFLLLEELLAIERKVPNLYKCICLLYNLAHETREGSHEVELYKDCYGILSYFISFEKISMSNGEIPLTIVFLCGKSNIKNRREENVPSNGKPLFRKITYKGLRNDNQEDVDRPSGFGYLVFLRSLDLLDINDLRRVKETIVESIKTLESPSKNADCHGNVFIEVVPNIDPVKLPQLFLHLRSIQSCLVESDEPVLSGQIREPRVQNLYLQRSQKPLTFKDESELNVFVALFQYTFFNLGIVDVLQKTRKEMVCVLKEHPSSLLTLHAKANVAYLTLQGVGNKCSRDGTVENDVIKLIDDRIHDCFEKLCISSINGPQNPWRSIDEQSDESPIFFDEEEDALEKAHKTNARVTAELQYLQEKTQKLTTRAKTLLGQLSEMEGRASLLQDHFLQTICSDKDRAIAAEKWFAKKRRQIDPREATSDGGDNELEELLESLSNDELAEFLAENQMPCFDFVSDKTSDESRERSFDEDFEGAGCFTSSDKRRITQEEKTGANGKSFDQELYNNDVEGKDSSGRPRWHLPSPETTQDFFSLNIAAEKTELPILREEFTQTDSLSLVQEYKDVDVQTDPTQLTNEETLEKGIADFERDRAARQLRKSRLFQDVIAFWNRPRESAPDSIVTETSGFFSEGTPQDSISSGSLQLQQPSKCSIVSEASSHGTEDVSSEETPRDSVTSGSLPLQPTSRYHTVSEATSHGAEDIASKGTSQDPLTSGSLPLQQPSQSSIVSEASSHGTKDVSSKGTAQDSITSSYLSLQLTSRYHTVSEAKSHGIEDVSSEETPRDTITSGSLPLQPTSRYHTLSEATIHGTEDVSSKVISGSLPLQQPSKCSIVSEASSHGTEDVSSEGTPRDSISEAETSGNEQNLGDASFGFSNIQETYTVEPRLEVMHSTGLVSKTCLDITRESGNADLKNEDDITLHSDKCINTAQEFSDNKPGTNEKRVPILSMEKLHVRKLPLIMVGDKHAGKTSLLSSIIGPKEASKEYLDVVDGRPQVEETQDRSSAYCHGHIYPTLPSKGSCRSSTRVGHGNARNRSSEGVESDGGETRLQHVNGRIAYSDIISKTPANSDITLRRVACNDEKSTPRKPELGDVKSYNRISTDDVKSRSDGANNELYIGSSTVDSNVVSSYAKPHKNDESLAEDKLQKSERSQVGPTKFIWNEQSNATDTTNNEDAVSLDNNADRTVSSYRNGNYMSLPTRVVHEASNTEKRSDRIHSLVFSNTQQDDRNEASLSVIKEADDSEENDDIWNSQGARPKRIGLHDDYIVSGVDNSFLARHSNDSSLTRSVYSRTRVHNKHKPFSSLPVYNNEREEVPFVARTWPVCDERLLPDQNTSSSSNEQSRLPYQGLPCETKNEPVRSFDTGMYSCKEQTKNEYGGAHGNVALPGSHSVVPRTISISTLNGSHSYVSSTTDTPTLPGSHSYVSSTTDTPTLPGSHSYVSSTTDTPTLPGSHSYVASTTGTPTLPGSHSDVASTTATPTLPGSHSDVTSTTGTPTLPGSHSDVASTTGTPTLLGSHSDVASTTGTPTLPGSHSAVQMKEQSQVAFDNIHEQRSPSTFGLPPLPNTEHTSDGLTNVSPTQNTNNNSSSDDDLYKTADNSLESLESFEDQINKSRMTWSQMSESVRVEHDEDDEQEESLNEDMQTEQQGETERTLLAASGEGDEMNGNRSEIKGKCKNGTNGKSVESGGKMMRLISWAKNLGKTERETRETDSENRTTSHSQTREDINTQAAEQVTSLSTQRVSAEVFDARERESRKARAREREERRKKEDEDIKRRLESLQKEKEESAPSSPQPARLPVQESITEWPCGHYKRRCSIKFPCCENFYFCHRCHNDSDDCEIDNMKALNGTHLRCLVCNTEQEITENSHHCINCSTQLAEYFCAICKHFTGNEKTPYHCTPCGICRIHRDRSFHCDVCNVCLDERLRNNHKCRPDSGHDECCICLEDAFGGCQILPCSHKVHRECAVAMLKNGVRKCPVCRHPLNLPLPR